ncbi:MAG: hypothetical protein KKB21_04620 [Nanoarchaeota archaeon]|nr:hypothetical protein [Nanoarchaeota archaeon]MBU4086830.1 hypothetical protein [Nanoarchaeota archaeon]
MRIVKLNECADKVLFEIDRFRSNERGKLINLNLIDVSESADFGGRNIILGNSEKTKDSLKEFAKHFYGLRKSICLIMFNKNFDIEFFENAVLSGFSKESVLLVGAENLSGTEISFLSENKIRRVNLGVFLEDIFDACDVVMEFSSGKQLFLLFDFSVLDSVSPGGLSMGQVVYILSRMGLMKNLDCVYFSGVLEEKKLAKLVSEVL